MLTKIGKIKQKSVWGPWLRNRVCFVWDQKCRVCETGTVYESYVCKVSLIRLNQKCKQTCTHIYADFIMIDAMTWLF